MIGHPEGVHPRRVLVAVLLVAAVTGLLVLTNRAVSHPARGAAHWVAPTHEEPRQARATPLEVLRRWDLRRSAAYAHGDRSALRVLYLPGSRTGTRDLAMLAVYRRRGLRVRGMDRQYLQFRVLRQTRSRLVLVVTDRLSRGTVRGPGVRLRLPADRPGSCRVVLVRSGGRWVVSEARVVS